MLAIVLLFPYRPFFLEHDKFPDFSTKKSLNGVQIGDQVIGGLVDSGLQQPIIRIIGVYSSGRTRLSPDELI